MRVLTVAGLKGGVGKTTSAVHLAHALARRGSRVLLVDTDPQGSALTWSEQAAFPLATIGLPVRDVHRRLPALAGDFPTVEARADRPKKRLVAFERIHLAPGVTKTVSVTIASDQLAFWNETKKAWVVDPAAFELMVGGSSADTRLRAQFEAAKP